MAEFPGISADSLFLLAENRFQDSKAFYEANKPTINRTVVYPLRQLVAELTPPLLAVDPLLQGGVSRVRRDNRFTHDKLMYRENMWIVFSRDKRAWNWCVPAFFLDFSLQGAEWGLGFYSATPAVMKCLRSRLEADPSRAIAAVEQAQQAGFIQVGQPYARPRSTDATPEALRSFYDCRNVLFCRQEPADFVADSELPRRLLAGYEALAPLYTLLTEAMEEVVGLREI